MIVLPVRNLLGLPFTFVVLESKGKSLEEMFGENEDDDVGGEKSRENEDNDVGGGEDGATAK